MTVSVPVTVDPGPVDPRGPGGLLALLDGVERALPLASVRVRTHLAGDVARTVVTQTFDNDLKDPVEAVHLFPLPETGAVVAMVLEAGDVRVEAACQEKAEAERTFAEAREQGHRAALLTAERDDVHTLRVTRLPPGESVRVHIEVVEQLEAVDGRVRWRFPTVIPPRYLPGNPVSHEGIGVLPDTDRAPDASRLQPPLRLEGGVPLDLEVHVAGPVTSIGSSLHAVRLDLEAGDVRVAPTADATCDRDFVLDVGTSEAGEVTPRAWTDGVHTLVLVGPPALAFPQAIPRDAVFVIDISGSMGGRKIEAARTALRTALRGLVPGDRFRLIAFDDRIEAQTAGLVPFDEAHLAAAEAWVDRLHPRGGTEMLAPIREALAGDVPEGRLRTVLFITDGQAWNEGELVAAVAHRRRQARFFSLGIDTAVNGSLLRRLARVGGGTCELLTPADDIEAAVARIEARFGSPVLHDVCADGLESASMASATVFSGRPASLLLAGAPEAVVLSGTTAEGPWTATVTPRPAALELAPLWARRRIAALEDRLTCRPHEEEALRGVILELALKHHLVSRYTAFVAVERSRTVGGELREVVQPVEAPEGWDMRESAPMQPVMSMAVPLGAAAAPPPPRLRKARAPSPSRKRSRGLLDGVGRLFSRSKAESFDADDADEEIAASAPMAVDALADEAPEPMREASVDPEVALVRTQGVDGSFGGDVARTTAALLALVLLGHTRRTGLRRRAVLKAAAWLAGRSEPVARRALEVLEAAEAGTSPTWEASWDALLGAGEEGRLLGGLRGGSEA